MAVNPVWPFKEQIEKQGYENNPLWTDEPANPSRHMPCGYWRRWLPGESWRAGEHDEWTFQPVGGMLPPARSRHTAVIYNNKMYIFGGYESHRDSALNDLWMYDFDSNLWTELHPSGTPPTPCAHASAVVYQNKMFITGGYRIVGGGGTILPSSQHVEYNFSTNAWTRKDYISRSVYNHTAVVIQDKILLFSGYWSDYYGYSKRFGTYDITTDNWSYVISSADPFKRLGHSAVVRRHKMYIFGGRKYNYSHLNDLWVYDYDADSWEEKTPCPVGIQDAFAVENNQIMYVVGGKTNPTSSDKISLWAYHLVNDEWEEKSAIDHYYSYYHTLVNFEGSLYFFSPYEYDGSAYPYYNVVSNDMYKYRI